MCAMNSRSKDVAASGKYFMRLCRCVLPLSEPRGRKHEEREMQSNGVHRIICDNRIISHFRCFGT